MLGRLGLEPSCCTEVLSFNIQSFNNWNIFQNIFEFLSRFSMLSHQLMSQGHSKNDVIRLLYEGKKWLETVTYLQKIALSIEHEIS